MKNLLKVILFNCLILLNSCGSSPLDDVDGLSQIEQQDLADVEKTEASPNDSSQMSGDSTAMSLSNKFEQQVEIPDHHKSLPKKSFQDAEETEVKKELENLKKSLSEKDQEFKDLAKTKIPELDLNKKTLDENSVRPPKPVEDKVSNKETPPKKMDSPMLVNFAVEPKKQPTTPTTIDKKERKPSSETKDKSKVNFEKESFSFWPVLLIFSGVAIFYLFLNRLKYKNRFNLKK